MAGKSFVVQGTFLSGNKWHRYEKTVTAPSEKLAVERIYTVFGSKHRLKRREITVDQVRPAAGESSGAGRSP
jgi:large subunit ribosomal protein LX